MHNLMDLPLAFGHRELRRYLPSLGRPARAKLLAELGVDIAGRRVVPASRIMALLEPGIGDDKKAA